MFELFRWCGPVLVVTTPLSTPQFSFASASVRGQQLFGLSLRTSQMGCLILLVHHICTLYSLSVVAHWLIFIISTLYFKTLHAMADRSTNGTVDWRPNTMLSASLIRNEDKKGQIFYYFQVATIDEVLQKEKDNVAVFMFGSATCLFTCHFGHFVIHDTINLSITWHIFQIFLLVLSNQKI